MKYVSYLRVSTDSQGTDGNGISAQRNAVNRFATAEGSSIIREFIEIESGANSERAILRDAMEWAEMTGSMLLVKTLDRISRDLNFITSLEKSSVAFRIVDMPSADAFTLHIYGALAQRERELISVRTKAALAALKVRGITKKGNVYVAGKSENFSDAGRSLGTAVSADVRSDKSSKFNAMITPTIAAYRSERLSLAAIAEKLNADGLKTRRGGAWSAMTVSRLLG